MSDQQSLSALWQRYVNVKAELEMLEYTFRNRPRSEVLDCLKEGLTHPGERRFALDLLRVLPEENRRALMLEIIGLAAWQNGQMQKAQELVFSVSGDWLQENLESLAEQFIAHADPVDLWGLLDICSRVDKKIALKLAQRFAASADPDIRDAGESFVETLGNLQ
jgi:hypothetical protein